MKKYILTRPESSVDELDWTDQSPDLNPWNDRAVTTRRPNIIITSTLYDLTNELLVLVMQIGNHVSILYITENGVYIVYQM